jgi:asparagine synthase (glutamine-hydrolysing)
MLSTVSHRGPDASGVWREGNVGLGQCLLRTTPESLKDSQPLTNRRGDLVLISDARIDNRGELISALDLNSSPAEITDSQLILSAYEKWGESCPGRLLGDFVFAIWNNRDRRIFLARDYFGLKPVYYFDSEKIFLFASEVKALFINVAVPREINEERLAFVLTSNPSPNNTITYYRGILRLSPAHTMAVTSKSARMSKYWSLDPSMEVNLRSDLEYTERFLEIFTEAVQSRLRRITPIGSMLSGGLDSSSIACVARNRLNEANGEKLHTFSAVFPGAPPEDIRSIDERKFVDSVLAGGGYLPHFIRADRLSPLFDFDRLIESTDEPTMATNIYLHLAAFKLANLLGIRPLLDGIDGDTVVSHGWGILDEYRRNWNLVSLSREFHSISQLYEISLKKTIWLYFLRPLVPPSVKRMWRVLRAKTPLVNGLVEEYVKYLNPSFVQRVSLPNVLEGRFGSNPSKTESPKETHWRNLMAPMWTDIFEFCNKSSHSYSVETRYPFWDKRLVEFCFGIPSNQKFRNGWSRSILRRSLEGILPKEVQWRLRKANLFSNLLIRLFEHEELAIAEVIEGRTLGIDRFYDVKKLRQAYSLYKNNPRRGIHECQTLFAAVVLTKWLRSISQRWKM